MQISSFVSLHWLAFCIQKNYVKTRIYQSSSNKSHTCSPLFQGINRASSNESTILNGIPNAWVSLSDRRQLCCESVHKLCVSNWQVDKTLTKNNYLRSSTWKGCLLFRRDQRNNEKAWLGAIFAIAHTQKLFLTMHLKTVRKKPANKMMHYNTLSLFMTLYLWDAFNYWAGCFVFFFLIKQH